MTGRRLYIVDDNEAFLDATRFWLEGLGLQIEAWSDPRAAVAALCGRPAGPPACLLLDIRMPYLSGLDVHDALLAAGASLPIVYMSGHADVPLAVQAMRKGAVTLLEKPFDEDTLQAALDSAFALAAARPPAQAADAAPPPGSAGTSVASADADAPATSATSVASGAAAPPAADPSDLQARERFQARERRLSPREREVLGHVVQGVYNKNIADRIGLSIKTVELYRARGMAKMQARSVAELTRMMVSGRVG